MKISHPKSIADFQDLQIDNTLKKSIHGNQFNFHNTDYDIQESRNTISNVSYDIISEAYIDMLNRD